MIGYNFIFSNRILFRLSRHLVFWLVFSMWIYLDHNGEYHLPHLPVCILTTYTTLYFLIPRYLLRNKYRSLIILMIIFSVLYPILFIFNPIAYFSDPDKFVSDHGHLFDGVFDKQDVIIWKVAQWDAWGLTMFLSGFAAVIKLMKLYYLENSENKRLQEQKINHELQLLKSQLNSRFLFDALQNIKQHLRTQSSGSSGLILKLSDLLSYMLYEGDEKSVPLRKEIEIVEEYLKLENEARGNIIEIKVTYQGEIDERRIVPLVLLPLVESCFEYSSAVPSKGSGIFLDFNVRGLILKVTLAVNNIRGLSHEVFQKSIRLKNAKQRLNSCYTGKHQLEIVKDNQNFIVQLELAL